MRYLIATSLPKPFLRRNGVSTEKIKITNEKTRHSSRANANTWLRSKSITPSLRRLYDLRNVINNAKMSLSRPVLIQMVNGDFRVANKRTDAPVSGPRTNSVYHEHNGVTPDVRPLSCECTNPKVDPNV